MQRECDQSPNEVSFFIDKSKVQEVKKDKPLLISWRSSTLKGSFLLMKSRFVLYQFIDMLWFASAGELCLYHGSSNYMEKEFPLQEY